MKDIRLLFDYVMENKLVLVTTALGICFGAFLGVLAYYHGWLG